jgi:hypothetical protein
MVNQQEQTAMKFVRDWAEKQQITVKHTDRKGVGYDYEFTYPNGKVEKIEVKGTKGIDKIPDMSVREFNNEILKADFLLVIGNVLDEKKVLYKIPRQAIGNDNLRLKKSYQICKFQNRKNMQKYKVELKSYPH